MQSQNRMFDDFVKMMNGAAGTFAGMSREAEGAFRDRVRDWIGGLDMVGRDEFEAVKAIAVAAREESQALRARVEALEAGSRQSSTLTGSPVAAAKPRRKGAKAGPAEGAAGQ